MSNYPNMSYCMAENTLLAMRQLLDSMEEEGVELLRNMNRTERAALQDLFYACESFIDLSDALLAEEEYDQYDGQPDEAQEWADFDPDC